MGCSPPPYVASPKVDPQLDLRGGTMHVRNRCTGAVGICSRRMGLFWPTRGSAEPKWRSPRPAFLRTTDRWALVLILGCILLGTPISSGSGALLLSETHVQDILCISSVFTCVFLLSRICVPTINNSPTLVKFVSNNSYHYCWCSIFKTLCRS